MVNSILDGKKVHYRSSQANKSIQLDNLHLSIENLDRKGLERKDLMELVYLEWEVL